MYTVLKQFSLTRELATRPCSLLPTSRFGMRFYTSRFANRPTPGIRDHRPMSVTLDAALRVRGNLVRTTTLRKLGVGQSAIDAAIRSGDVLRVIRPWVATPLAERDAVIAVVNRGRLADASALGSYGVWRGLDRSIHVLLPPHYPATVGSSRTALSEFGPPEPLTTGVVRHWADAPAGDREWRVPPTYALASFARRQTPEMFVAAVDSALHEKVIKPSDLPLLRDLLPRRLRRLLELVDGRSESGCESLARLRLASLGRTIDIQVQIGPHRVDLLIDGWLIIEIDSEKWHSSTRVADSRRDTDLIPRGYRIKHFDYAEVIYDWPAVEAAIVEMLRNPAGSRAARSAR